MVAARQAGVKTIVIPKANTKDLVEIPAEVRKEIQFVPVEQMDEVLEHALERMPEKNEVRNIPGAQAPGSYTRH